MEAMVTGLRDLSRKLPSIKGFQSSTVQKVGRNFGDMTSQRVSHTLITEEKVILVKPVCCQKSTQKAYIRHLSAKNGTWLIERIKSSPYSI